jgi:hypothetical protein
MDDVKHPSPVPAERDPEHQAEVRRLEQMLNEGLDDLDAGRTVAGDAVYRRLKAKIAASQPPAGRKR